MAHLVTGLSFYQENTYIFAARAFEAIIDGSGCPGGAVEDVTVGRDIASLFLGNIRLLEGDLEDAERWYTTALAADPAFSRARFGLAEVQFQRGSDECGVGASNDAVLKLRDALAGYEQAFDDYRAGIASGSRDAVRFLEVKARLGIGRVRLCLSSVGEPTGADARSDFLDVILEYEAATSRDQIILSPVASEAYAGLAFSHILDEASPDELSAALDALSKAVRLNPTSSRLVLFLATRAWVYGQLGLAEEADADCAAVEDLDPEDFSCPVGPNARFYEPVAFTLPFTGTESGALLAVSLWLVAIGAAMLVVVNPRSSRDAAGDERRVNRD